jgi:hypothetical protein
MLKIHKNRLRWFAKYPPVSGSGWLLIWRRAFVVAETAIAGWQYDDLRREIASGVGAYWINEGDYPALLKIFPDGNRMARTWAE